jgi:hypothetical protein
MPDRSSHAPLGVPLGVAALSLFTLAGPVIADLVARPDVAALRAAGPAGLDELLVRYDRASPAEQAALADDVDAVAGQRYATVSRLYWFTELDRAEAAAHALHRPILALRMLGDLRADLSCANSRLFRATLYANAEVAAFLREHFVLYWSSERAVPVVTIDYGDGRKLVRTTTGNSAHYVLDERGHVLDVLPGLYAPAAFRAELANSLALAGEVRGLPDAERVRATVAHHAAQIAATERDWLGAGDAFVDLGASPVVADARARALLAAQRATVTKAIVEVPDLVQIGVMAPADVPRDDATWAAIGQRIWGTAPTPTGGPAPRPAPAVLDARSLALVARLHNAGPAEQRATPSELAAVIARLEQHILADTALDQFVLRQQIRKHIVAAAETELTALNAWVYSEVFVTPRTDPWLGLLPRTEFTGVPGDGVVMP